MPIMKLVQYPTPLSTCDPLVWCGSSENGVPFQMSSSISDHGSNSPVVASKWCIVYRDIEDLPYNVFCDVLACESNPFLRPQWEERSPTLKILAIQCISFTLLLETVQYHHHLKATVCLCFVTPIGIITLSIISWLIKNWRYIQLAISAPGIVCLGYFWLIPRSLPWLLAEGYASEAEKQLVQFARFNKAMLPLNFRVRVFSFCKKIKSYATGSQHSLETVVCSAKIRRYTFILYYIWFVISLDSETSSSELPALKDNKYASLFVKGLMDTGVLILLYFFAQRFGPRSAHGTALVIGGLFCVGSVLLGYSTYFSEIKPITHLLILLSPILSVIGKACIRSAAATSIFFSLKIFPTGV
ncbi:Organic cation transporter protein, partial [Araneus ventricosus]